MPVEPMSRELRVVLNLINEQNAHYQALLSVLGESGLIDVSAVHERSDRLRSDPNRALQIFANFQRLLSEIHE